MGTTGAVAFAMAQADLDQTSFRDTGPISSRNSSKGALLGEAHSVFRLLAPGVSIERLRRACIDGEILRHRARETRRRVWEALHWRYFAWSPPTWVLSDFADAANGTTTDRRFVHIAYLHFARRDRLTFEFVTERLWSLRQSGVAGVTREDVIDFLTDRLGNTRSKWRESTKVKLTGNVLSALRDFGLLTGVQRKRLQHRMVVTPHVVLHLCRLLDAEGLRGRTLLEARDWRLFLWDVQQTSQAMGQLAQLGALRFERSGRTVVLDVPRHPLDEHR